MFRKFYEDSGETDAWKALYSELSKDDREEMMDLVSLPIAELRNTIIPKKFSKIMPYLEPCGVNRGSTKDSHVHDVQSVHAGAASFPRRTEK